MGVPGSKKSLVIYPYFEFIIMFMNLQFIVIMPFRSI